MHRPRPAAELLVRTGLLLALAGAGLPAAEALRVGIYDNSPKVFLDAGGRPQGIFVEVLEGIAASEGWTLDYRPQTWNEAYAALRAGELDLLVDVAHSPQRAAEVHIGAVRVLDSWLDCYARRGQGPRSLSELSGRRVAVLAGSVQEAQLHRLAEAAELFPGGIAIQTHPSYAAMTRALLGGEAEVAVASRFWAFSPERPPELEPTHLVLFSTGLHFATPLGDPRQVAAVIDRHLARLKNDPASSYYRALSRWLVAPRTTVLPAWLAPALVALAGLLLLSLAWTLALRRQVACQTAQLAARAAELERANHGLDLALAETRSAREEERRSFQRLAAAQRLETLGRLTGGVAHDFRNVLAVITASVELALRHAPEDERLRGALRRTLEAAQRAAGMIGQLLDFARRQPSSPQRLELEAALRERASMLALLVGPRIRLHWETAPGPMPVRIDAAHLDQILLNLLGNAREAIAEAGTIIVRSARVELTAENLPEPGMQAGMHAELRIEDDGCGIAAADLPRLREPFFTTKAEVGGTGLGLATVAGILASLKGGLAFAPRPGGGTVARVWLPLED